MKKAIFFSGVLLSMLFITPAFAQVNYFLFIDGAPGDSMDKVHKAWIDILAFKIGATQGGTVAFGGGGAGKVSFQDLSISKRIDRSSVVLNRACTTGQHIKQVVLSCALKGGMQQEFYRITLSDVLVTAARVGGDNTGPVEEFSFNYAKIEWQFSPFGQDGRPSGPPVKGGYDLKTIKSF